MAAKRTVSLVIEYKNGKLVSRELEKTNQAAAKIPKNVERSELALKKAKIAAVAFGVAIVVAFKASIKGAIDYQQQLATVATMLDRQTMHLLPQFRKEIDKMRIAFGEGSATLTKGAFDILSAGIDASKAMEVLTVSARAAKAGLTDTALAVDVITTLINSYQLAADDASRVSDILFATVKRGKTTFAELGATVGQVAALSSTAGLKIEELSGLLATMTRNGVGTAEAVTSVQAILTTFLTPAADAAKLARQFGFELNTTTLRAEGMLGVTRKLSTATAEQLAVIFPNVRALRGLSAALQDVEGFARDYQLALESLGLTEAAFNIQIDTTASSLSRLWEAYKVGTERAVEPFVDMMDRAAKAVLDYLDAVNKVEEPVPVLPPAPFFGPGAPQRLTPEGIARQAANARRSAIMALAVGRPAAPGVGGEGDLPAPFNVPDVSFFPSAPPPRGAQDRFETLTAMRERDLEELFSAAGSGFDQMAALGESSAMTIGNAFSGMFANMASGAMGAGDAIMSAVLGALGTIATMWGSFLVSVGLGMTVVPGLQLNGPTAVAAGAALLALGGILQGVAGSSGGGGGGVGGGGGGGTPFNTGSSFGGGTNIIIVASDGRTTSGGNNIGRALNTAGVSRQQSQQVSQIIHSSNRSGDI